MVTKKEMIAGYEKEIAFQKHMIENLGRWFNLMFLVASLGVVTIYFFKDSLLGLILGGVITVLALLAMLVFGYGIHKGRINVQKLIADFERKCV